jgi:hypothetical protein
MGSKGTEEMRDNMKQACDTALCLVLSLAMMITPIGLTGCNEDQIIGGIKTAADVITQAGNILRPLNPKGGAILSAVAQGLADLDKAYEAYDQAAAANKPGAVGTIEALVATLQGQLSSILADVQIKNPELVAVITVAVAVANSAILALYNHVAAKSAPVAAEHTAVFGTSLPTIPNAKSSKDLAKAWNQVVGKDFQVKAR